MLSAMHCNTANGLAALDFTALCLVAAVRRVPLPLSVEVAGFSFSDRCYEASVSLGSPLSVGSPARASDACCHLRLIPFSVCAPGVPVPVSARSAEGQLLGQSPSVTLSLSWMLVRCLDNPLGPAVISAGSVTTLAAPVGCVLLFICLSAGRG